MNRKPINIIQLYPRDMNIYGDWGNVLVVKRRLEWLGYQPIVTGYNVGDDWPDQADIIIGGGGQDSGQSKIASDLQQIAGRLSKLAEAGTPMLMICGLYQLFGHEFITQSGQTIPGIGLLDVTTTAGPERLIGNIITSSPDFGQLVGFENHSGLTNLGPGARPLASVIRGSGNNGIDGLEGARYHNVIGSYLHGPILPKNPRLSNWIIQTAIINRYGDKIKNTKSIDDRYALLAHKSALDRKR